MLRCLPDHNSVFTKEEKLWLVTNCFNLGAIQAWREFRRHYQIRNRQTIPHRQSFKNLFDSFQRIGCIFPAASSGRPRLARTQENSDDVVAFFSGNSHASQQAAAQELGISLPSINRILKKDVHWYPYRPKIVQKLMDAHKRQRMEASEFL
jgi:hypothetical protein